MKDPIFIVVDLFCGFGGTTQGYELAEMEGNGIALVFACVNHDPKAIKSHWLNHPNVKHFEEDIRTLGLAPLITLVKQMRARYPNAKLILWASMECTDFSKAKGGQPRNADSRTLADHIIRYLDALDVDYFKYENVVEFMSWGPLDENGKPVSRKSGEDWLRWVAEIERRGFRHDWRELNSANYGAYTSRNRLFGIFAKDGLPIAWPAPTRAKKPSVGMHGGLKKWMAVKDVLNFEDEGESILTREKPLVDTTLERIYAGLIKFVAMGDTSFLSKYFSGKPSDKNVSTDGPAGTIMPNDKHRLVTAEPFLMPTNYSNKPKSLDEPAPTITANRKHHYLVNHIWGGNVSGVGVPGPTIIARQDKTPLYLISVDEGPVSVAVYETDTHAMIKIKQFMAAYCIVDIKMRMLRVIELLLIQGFPSDYKMVGNQADHKKFIGNSVHPLIPKYWSEAMAVKLLEFDQKVA